MKRVGGVLLILGAVGSAYLGTQVWPKLPTLTIACGIMGLLVGIAGIMAVVPSLVPGSSPRQSIPDTQGPAIPARSGGNRWGETPPA